MICGRAENSGSVILSATSVILSATSVILSATSVILSEAKEPKPDACPPSLALTLQPG